MRTLLVLLMFAVVDASAADSVRVTNVIDSYPNPSPDGETIIFQSNRTGTWQMYLCNPDGTNVRQVGNFAFPVAGPSWSPDGRRITFAGEPGGDSEIFLMNANGGNVVQLTKTPGDDSHPHWSPDGLRIMFNSARTTPDPKADWSRQWHELFSMKPDGSDVLQHTRCRTVCTYGSFAPDMKRVTYRKVIDAPAFQWDLSNATRNSEIFTANIDGSGERNISASAAFDGWPAWSPDGTRIAFASNRAGPAGVGQIYVVMSDGSAIARITGPVMSHAQPAWSSDGKSIYAYQNTETADYEHGGIVRIAVP